MFNLTEIKYQDTSTQGRIGELLVTNHLLTNNYMVCKPEIDNNGIDLVVANPKRYKSNARGGMFRFTTIQVKYNRTYYQTNNGYNLRLHVKKNTLAEWIACPIEEGILDDNAHVLYYPNKIKDKRYIKEFGVLPKGWTSVKKSFGNQYKRLMIKDYLKLPK